MSTLVAPRYTAADSITVLEGLEAVRKRPAMYIGGVDPKGLHHLVWEIVDNSVDEHLNGHADSIIVTLHKTGDAVSVQDNGRGIPVDIHPKYGKPGLELILTTLHSGAKFGETDSYIHSGGLHGVGSSVVNALSRKLVATVRRDGFDWRQTYAAGKPITTLDKAGTGRGHGTTIYFEPDETIFKTTRFDPDLIRSHLEDMSYIHSRLRIIFRNEMTGEEFDLAHPGGIVEFLGKLITDGQKATVTDAPFTLARNGADRMECTLQWTEGDDETIKSYVNGIRTPLGGTHENGFKNAVVKAIRNYMEIHEVKTKGLSITAEDIRSGLVGVLSVFVREPMFQGQTKERLNNPELTAVVDGFVRPALESWLNAHKTAAENIVGRIVMAAKARLASKEAASEVKRKSATSRRLNLPGKLADCQASDRSETELFVVEGDSAGGSAKQGRDNRTQAVLPLRGKILNTEGKAFGEAASNKELADLISAIGTGAGPKFDINGLRYGKVILLMDADVDGYHISTLLLTFLFRHMTELIRKGHVYLAQPPLYKVVAGKETFWARDDAHLEQIKSRLRANAKPEITRFKGLGEMDAKQLRETTLDPRNRTLLRVDIESLIEADRIFTMWLGKDAGDRSRKILEKAALAAADDLDV